MYFLLCISCIELKPLPPAGGVLQCERGPGALAASGLEPGGQGGAGGLHAPGEGAGRAAGLPGPHQPGLPGHQSDVPQVGGGGGPSNVCPSVCLYVVRMEKTTLFY